MRAVATPSSLLLSDWVPAEQNDVEQKKKKTEPCMYDLGLKQAAMAWNEEAVEVLLDLL